MVEKIAYMLGSYDEEKDNDRTGFIQVRLVLFRGLSKIFHRPAAAQPDLSNLVMAFDVDVQCSFSDI